MNVKEGIENGYKRVFKVLYIPQMTADVYWLLWFRNKDGQLINLILSLFSTLSLPKYSNMRSKYNTNYFTMLWQCKWLEENRAY